MSLPTKLEICIEKIPGTDISFTMVKVPGGELREDGKVLCEVSNFWIGQGLVTQKLWKEIMGDNPSRFRGKAYPVDSVSWYDAVEFCNELNLRMGYGSIYDLKEERQMEMAEEDDSLFSRLKNLFSRLKVTSNQITRKEGYRLLTEAEWQYAASGLGDFYQYSGSQNLEKVCWYRRNSGVMSQSSNLKFPNGLGIFDMSGNLWEWCYDWYSKDFPSSFLKDPKGPNEGRRRVLRGGSWYGHEFNCQVSARSQIWPDGRSHSYGFRLAKTAIEE